TTKDVGQGSGLGLASVHGIITQSGGHIEVESQPGCGATFRIYFPRVEETARPSAPEERPPELPHGTETVLLVEDETTVRILTAELLRKCGYAVLESPNGEAALGSAPSTPGRSTCW